MLTLNKGELITAIAEKTPVAKKDVEQVINGFIETVGDTLQQGEDVTLVGFGSFIVKDQAARVGRNPATGEPLEIPAKKVPGFKAGKPLKEKLT